MVATVLQRDDGAAARTVWLTSFVVACGRYNENNSSPRYILAISSFSAWWRGKADSPDATPVYPGDIVVFSVATTAAV